MNAFDFCWKHKYLDRPRAERWAAFDHAKAEGHAFDADDLLDALGLDAESWAELFKSLPPQERLAAGRLEAKRRGIPFSAPALFEAFSGTRW